MSPDSLGGLKDRGGPGSQPPPPAQPKSGPARNRDSLGALALSPRRPGGATSAWTRLLQGPSTSSPSTPPAGASCALQDVQHLQMAPTVPWWAKPTLVKRHCSLIQHLELGGRNSPGEVRTCACSDSAGLGGELGHGLRLRAPRSVPCPRRRSSGCDGRGLHDFV